MKVYISCHHPDPANALADALTAAGHEVVSSWHRSDEPRPAKDDAAAWGRLADRNFREIERCQALAVVAGPDRYAGGKFVEAGWALPGSVVTVGGVENGMLYHLANRHVADATELIRLLDSGGWPLDPINATYWT